MMDWDLGLLALGLALASWLGARWMVRQSLGELATKEAAERADCRSLPGRDVGLHRGRASGQSYLEPFQEHKRGSASHLGPADRMFEALLPRPNAKPGEPQNQQ